MEDLKSISLSEFTHLVGNGKLKMDQLGSEVLAPLVFKQLDHHWLTELRWQPQRALRESKTVRFEFNLNIEDHPADAPIYEIFLLKLAKGLAFKIEKFLLTVFSKSGSTIFCKFCDESDIGCDEAVLIKQVHQGNTLNRTFFKSPQLEKKVNRGSVNKWIDTKALNFSELLLVDNLMGDLKYWIYFHVEQYEDYYKIKGSAAVDVSKIKFNTVQHIKRS